MSQIIKSGGGGGSLIGTINGDIGSITGSTVTIFANNATNNSGASVKFVNSGTVSTLNLTDANFNTYLGENAGVIGFGVENVAVGLDALSSISNNSANASVAVGFAALESVTSGASNTAVGADALQDISTGTGNTAIGRQAGSNLQSGGSFNCYLGEASGGTGHNTSGSYNLILGYQSGQANSNSESSNIYLCNDGALNENNVIRIGTQGTGNRQQNQCFIAGITGNSVSNQQFVTVNSATGQMGTASPLTKVAFYAYLSASTQSTTGATTVQADHVVFDIGSNYNNGTYTFTAPNTGVYLFGGSAYFASVEFYLLQFVATSITVPVNFNNAGVQQSAAIHTALIHMTAGDTCVFQAGSSSTVNIQNSGFIGGTFQTYWFGYQVA